RERARRNRVRAARRCAGRRRCRHAPHPGRRGAAESAREATAAAGALPFRGAVVRGDRPAARRLARQGQNRYFSRTRGTREGACGAWRDGGYEPGCTMSTDRNRHDEIERQVTRALQEQPPRRAPSTLERRVLAQIEAGATAIGWRRGFAHWPVAARVGFLAASVGVVKVALLVAMWLATPLQSPAVSVQLPSQITWLQTLFVAFGSGASAYRMVRAAH